MVIKRFEEYLEEGIAKKITPDLQRAEHLRQESEKKYAFLKMMIESFGINNNNANEYIEYSYNIIMFLIRGRMLREGFSSSGISSHEAEVAFSRRLGFRENEIQILDQLRYFRNGIL